MEFTNIPPQWDAEGAEPTIDLKKNGFKAGYKPPASYFNYLFHKFTECIKELQSKLNDSVGDIHYYHLSGDHNEHTVLTLIKEKWSTFPANKIVIAKVVCGTEHLAIIQRYANSNYGSVLLYGYGAMPTYYRLTNGSWYEYGEILHLSNVVNNLTSTSLAPLSANMGKYLEEKKADVETGTWTPICYDKGGNVVTPSAISYNKYVNNGGVVFLNCVIQFNADLELSAISGLPFSIGTGQKTNCFISGIAGNPTYKLNASSLTKFNIVNNGVGAQSYFSITGHYMT